MQGAAAETFIAEALVAAQGEVGLFGSFDVTYVYSPNGQSKELAHYLSHDAPVATLSNRAMKSICGRLNGTPRKCLGWRTPTETIKEELMKLR